MDALTKEILNALADTTLTMMRLVKLFHKQENHKFFDCEICKPYIDLSEKNRQLFIKANRLLKSE
jgi:hypothetical protein